MLAIAGLTFAYTSCTDYSEDIDKTNSRVDNLETKLADVEKQVASNKAAIEDLQKAKAEAEAAIKALQETVATLETKEDHKKDVDALKSTIEGLKGDVKALETRIKAIEDKLPSYATLEYVNATFATKEQMAAANEEIGKLDARLKIAEGQLKTLSDKYDSDLKISEIITKIDTAQKAADAAQKTASEALGKVDALVEALGVYAEKGVLEAKIKLWVMRMPDLTRLSSTSLTSTSTSMRLSRRLARKAVRFTRPFTSHLRRRSLMLTQGSLL